MKGAIETADKVTTVSPTYANEILDPWFSHGLDGLLRQKQYKLCGILNGIDVDVFNPATDPDIAQNYDVNTFQEGKAVCKAALQDEMGLNKDGSPVMAMVTRLVGHKGVDLVRSIAEGLLQQGIELVIPRLGRSPVRELLQRTLRPSSRPRGGLHRLQRQTGPAYLCRCRHLPDALPLRALRPGPDGLLPLRHHPGGPRNRGCAIPSTIPAMGSATASPLPTTTPTSCMKPAGAPRKATGTRAAGRFWSGVPWNVTSAGPIPPRATRVCTTRSSTSGNRS